MDDMSFLVDETYRLTELRLLGELEDGEETWDPVASVAPAPAAAPVALPQAPGIIYLVEKNTGTFVVRSFVAKNLKADFAAVLNAPEDFPSLKLIEGAQPRTGELRFFECDSDLEARALHERLGQRRLPLDEEALCNLSDPGFSWWLEEEPQGFVLHSKLNSLDEKLQRLGPLMDEAAGKKSWALLATTLGLFPLGIDARVETGRFCFQSPAHPFIAEAFLRVYRDGVIGEELVDLFKLFAKKSELHADLESLWTHLSEAAATRRLWLAIQRRLAELPSY